MIVISMPSRATCSSALLSWIPVTQGSVGTLLGPEASRYAYLACLSRLARNDPQPLWPDSRSSRSRAGDAAPKATLQPGAALPQLQYQKDPLRQSLESLSGTGVT